jgi:hypothetical protein
MLDGQLLQLVMYSRRLPGANPASLQVGQCATALMHVVQQALPSSLGHRVTDAHHSCACRQASLYEYLPASQLVSAAHAL